jgi:hypothetical protein
VSLPQEQPPIQNASRTGNSENRIDASHGVSEIPIPAGYLGRCTRVKRVPIVERQLTDCESCYVFAC